VAALSSALRKALRRRQASAGQDRVASAAAMKSCAQAVMAARTLPRGWQDEQALHDLRVAVKKYRGALMALAEAQPTAARTEALAALQEVQHVLGEHHDWSELARRLHLREEALARDLPRAAAYRALRARAEKEQKLRFDRYLELHERLPALVTAHRPRRRSAPAAARQRSAPAAARRRSAPHTARASSRG
jgi:CHAD domain-containing protein